MIFYENMLKKDNKWRALNKCLDKKFFPKSLNGDL